MSNPVQPNPGGRGSLDVSPPELDLLLGIGHTEESRQELITLWNQIPTESERDVFRIVALQMQSVATLMRGEVVRFLEICGTDPSEVSFDAPKFNEQFSGAITRMALLKRQMETDGAGMRARCEEHLNGSRFVLRVNAFFWLPLSLLFDGWLLYQSFLPPDPPLMVPAALTILVIFSVFLTGMCVQQIVGFFQFRRLIAPLITFGLISKEESDKPDPAA